MQRTIDEQAFLLTQRGYAVYPVSLTVSDNGSKLPRFKGSWRTGDYPTDRDAIREHWEDYTGLAINTERSGLVVVDIDTGNGKDGHQALEDAGITLPDTPMVVLTQSGGEHRYYRAPEGAEVPSSASVLAPGVDIRAKGGLTFAPPTVVDGAGTAYAYADGARVVPVAQLPEFPAELVQRLSKPSRKPAERRSQSAQAVTLSDYQRSILEQRRMDALGALTEMQDGQRHADLLRLCPIVFGSAILLGEDPEDSLALVHTAYIESGGSDWEGEERTARDALRHALEQPYVPEGLDQDVEDAAPDPELELVRELVGDDPELIRQAMDTLKRQRVSDVVKRVQSLKSTTPLSDDDVIGWDDEDDQDDSLGLVHGLIPSGETVILFGVPTAGKSFAAVDIGLGVATGRGALGLDVTPGRVLYLAGEGTRGLKKRVRAWTDYYGVRPEPDRFQLRQMRLSLGDERSVRQHAELVQDTAADLVIVDTLMRAADGLDIVNATEAGRVIAGLDAIREANPGCSVLALHHPPESDHDKPAGSFPIRGNVDTLLKLENTYGVRHLTVTKAKDGDPNWSSSFELMDRAGSAVLVPRGSTVQLPVPDWADPRMTGEWSSA
ncbi:AAA family ATPase [Rhodococcus ruber]